ncbi:MAG TPA: putative glycolipid-binding domain-containing protein [Candidatus Tectomicrobia bacterium]|nr:putative glycolipid-binding domain-containing protein [Candidatus Tectomicrobia bacterium]
MTGDAGRRGVLDGRRRVVRWTDAAGRGLEHLVLDVGAAGSVAESVVIGDDEGEAFALRYRIACDAAWRVRALEIAVVGGGRLALTSDRAGRWTDEGGRRRPELDGAIDVDISVTPFTNTLPIRRCGLPPGAARDIEVAYVRAPALRLTREAQRYTRLDATRYRFESRDGDFVRDISVDADGLVIDYPGLFRRAA